MVIHLDKSGSFRDDLGRLTGTAYDGRKWFAGAGRHDVGTTSGCRGIASSYDTRVRGYWQRSQGLHVAGVGSAFL